jgi:hypothetical protein
LRLCSRALNNELKVFSNILYLHFVAYVGMSFGLSLPFHTGVVSWVSIAYGLIFSGQFVDFFRAGDRGYWNLGVM